MRFTLANERTYLAWIRTALALIAGGVALEALAQGLQPGFRVAAAIVLIATGIATPPVAWFSWMRSERALRRATPLPGSILGVFLASAVVAAGALILLALLLA